MKHSAIVLANGRYLTPNGKTAHGLVRGSDRVAVLAVVEPTLNGDDSGEALDGVHRGLGLSQTSVDLDPTAFEAQPHLLAQRLELPLQHDQAGSVVRLAQLSEDAYEQQDAEDQGGDDDRQQGEGRGVHSRCGQSSVT